MPGTPENNGKPEKPAPKKAAAAKAAPVAEAAVEAGAESPKMSFIEKHFRKNPEFIAEQKLAAGTDAAKLKKIEEMVPNSLRKRKVALVGAAVAAGAYGLYSVVAGTGNQGPGERAASVNQGRENEPAAGRA